MKPEERFQIHFVTSQKPKEHKDVTYNGWKNYETWNVALWIGNDEGLYDLARSNKRALHPYKTFASDLADVWDDQKIGQQTPDGVAWNDSGLDIEALDEMIREL